MKHVSPLRGLSMHGSTARYCRSAQNDFSSRICLLIPPFVVTILSRPPRSCISTIPRLLPVTLAIPRLPLSKRFVACCDTTRKYSHLPRFCLSISSIHSVRAVVVGAVSCSCTCSEWLEKSVSTQSKGSASIMPPFFWGDPVPSVPEVDTTSCVGLVWVQ